ncbi:S-layer homology domain-containing protein [Phormidium sp. FACHB-592]|uniref:S-layer homology domain-containing protein n=1 Tax=Stenomitos frigidus TaxID=1886765 RepID=UPI0016882E26|nr:S-layer homology domain-containing protein [Phormidium sp. FACHB-592]
MFLSRSPASLLLTACLLIPLTSCANSSLGESLEQSFAADPKLEENASSQPTETPTVSATPPFQPSIQGSETPTPTLSPSPSVTPQTNGSQASIPPFSDSTVVGASGNSDGSIDTTTASNNSNGGQATGTDGAIAFSDLTKAPKALQQYVSDLAQLGVLTPASSSKANQAKEKTLFEPNSVITRRDYVRWLVAANNRLYAAQPAKQIRLSTDAVQPAFQDVPRQDPDFPAIQGLAEAGLIPSSLTGDSTTVTFRPDAPLTREALILWKVPADTRQALPTASLDAIKQTWGFQDAARIDPKAMRAVLADFQNGDLANLRRAFGYTTLLQPKKAVTRAEAAAALWYFGFQGDGQSAQDALKIPSKP